MTLAARSAEQDATDIPGVPLQLMELENPHQRPPARHLYSRICAFLSKYSLMLAVAMLIAIIVCVQYQVVGRYVFNDTPTWAEGLALQLVQMYRIEADARAAILDRPRREWLGPIWRGLRQPGLRRKSAERALKLLLPRRWFGLRS